ncbi:hypothetical protein RQP46_008567 [Phenoliferia psychrophenolica]
MGAAQQPSTGGSGRATSPSLREAEERAGGDLGRREKEGGPGTTAGSRDDAAEVDDDDATATIDDEVEEPALERDLTPSEERATSAALERSRSHPPSRQPTSTSERRRAVLSSWDESFLKASTYSLLAFATIWGVLARLGLEWLGKFAEGEVFHLIWPQVVGCLVMGFVVDRKKGIEKTYVPLFVAMGTGFCGSLTTFSSWMHDVFVAFANLESSSSNRFRGFLSGVAVTIITLAGANAALRVGRHTLFLLLGPLFYLGAILLLALGPHSWRSRATFAIVLGPPGTFLRYELSRLLNAKSPTFPLGTFTANSLAVLLFAITAILQRRPTSELGSTFDMSRDRVGTVTL